MVKPSVRVLLVGGLPGTRLLQRQLNPAGSEPLAITCIERMDQAVQHLSANRFDIVLLDFALPDRHGAKIVQLVRRRDARIPVVWLSPSKSDAPDLEILRRDTPEFMVESRDNPQAIRRAIHYAVLQERHERALRESEERFRIASEASHAMVYDIDVETRHARFLHGLSELLGYARDENSQNKDWWFSQIHTDDLPSVLDQLEAARDRGTDYCIRYRMRHQDGNYIIVEDSGRNVFGRDGRAIRSVGSVVDVTKRVEASESLRQNEQRYRDLADELEQLVEARTADLWKLNRTLEMITNCGKAMVRETSEQALLEDICRIIVGVGGYQVAWIGFGRHDAASTIRIAAQAGQAGVCLKNMRYSWAEGDLSISAGKAIHTGNPCGHCGLQTNPAGESHCDYLSSIALPLKSQESTFGALTICSSAESAFDELQVQVLQELADDLAFGLIALRTRTELNTAMQDLEQQSLQLRNLAAELTQAEERERKRLAEAIHDELQQLLVAAKFCADTLEGGIQNAALKESAQQLNHLLGEAIESSRSLTFELSPPVLHNAGLAKALNYLGRRMEAKHGLVVNVRADESAEPELEELKILLFQSTRELLFNVVKHANVRTADVEMRRFEDNFVRITVSDSGTGFDPEKSGSEISQSGFGLFSIRGRLALIGGNLQVKSAPGAGSRCIMTAPLGRAAPSGASAWEVPAASNAKPRSGLMRAGHSVLKKNYRGSK